MRKEIVDKRSIFDSNYKTFTIYPNPTTSELTVIYNNDFGNGDLIIQSITGETLDQIKITYVDRLIIDVSNYKNGLYLISLVSEEKSEILKFLKN